MTITGIMLPEAEAQYRRELLHADNDIILLAHFLQNMAFGRDHDALPPDPVPAPLYLSQATAIRNNTANQACARDLIG